MICRNCGYENNTDENITFCPVCGNVLEKNIIPTKSQNAEEKPKEKKLKDRMTRFKTTPVKEMKVNESSVSEPSVSELASSKPPVSEPKVTKPKVSETNNLESLDLVFEVTEKNTVEINKSEKEEVKGDKGKSREEEIEARRIRARKLREEAKKQKRKKIIIAIVVVAILVLLIIGFNIIFKKKPVEKTLETINVSSYMDVTFTGSYGNGEASGKLDYLTMIADYPQIFQLDDSKREEIRKTFGVASSTSASDSELLKLLFNRTFNSDVLNAAITPNSGLWDKDIVTVSLHSGEDVLERLFDADFVFEKRTFTVEGLESTPSVDIESSKDSIYLSSYLSIEFYGQNGSGGAIGRFDYTSMINDYDSLFILNDEQKQKMVTAMGKGSISDSDDSLLTELFGSVFSPGVVTAQISPETGLKNGDTVTVNWLGGQSTLEDIFDVRFICDTKTIMVEGLADEASPLEGESRPSSEEADLNDDTEYIDLPYNLKAPAEHFLFPHSSQEYLTKKQLKAKFGKMTNAEKAYYVQLAINEIFFRYGWSGADLPSREGLTQTLNLFIQYDWYQEAIKYYPGDTRSNEFEMEYMNDFEKKNISLLAEWQMKNVK